MRVTVPVKSHRLAVANDNVVLQLARADTFIATVASLIPAGRGEWVVCWVTRNGQEPSGDLGADRSLDIFGHRYPRRNNRFAGAHRLELALSDSGS